LAIPNGPGLDVPGAISRSGLIIAVPIAAHFTTPAQDQKWLGYMTGVRLGTVDRYNLQDLNCIHYTWNEFNDAPLHW
jgi:hypothetical protein